MDRKIGAFKLGWGGSVGQEVFNTGVRPRLWRPLSRSRARHPQCTFGTPRGLLGWAPEPRAGVQSRRRGGGPAQIQEIRAELQRFMPEP
eukprot:2294242-Pyramimonas_sp.AAC.1